MALTSGLTASMRAMQASSSSTGEICLLPIRRRSSIADSAGRFGSEDMELGSGVSGRANGAARREAPAGGVLAAVSARGHRPQAGDGAAAHRYQGLVQVEGRIAMARYQQHLLAQGRQRVGAGAGGRATMPCSSLAAR